MVIVNHGHWMQGLGWVLLTVTCALALRRSGGGDSGSALFVAASYALLLTLLWCLRAFKRAAGAGDTAAEGRLKLAVWMLASVLTVLFATRVAPLMPGVAALLVWGMSAATVTCGFFLMGSVDSRN